MMLLLVCFAGFRDMIGGFDVYIYGEVYELPAARILLFEAQEIGFRLVYIALGLLSKDRYFMFFVFSIIVVAGHSYVIKKISPLVYFSVFILFCKFYLMSFVYVRQGLAMLLTWYTIPLLLKDRKFLAIVLVVAAFFIHKSSIVFAPFILIYNWRFTLGQLLFLSFAILVVSFSPIGQFAFGLIADQMENDKVNRYLDKSSSINVFYLIEVGMVMGILFAFRKQLYETLSGTMVANGLLLYFGMVAVSLTNATFIRLGWYYLIFYVLGFTYFVVFQRDKNVRLVTKLGVMVYFSLMFFRLLILYDSGDLMPYKSIFQDFERGGRFEFMEYRRN